MFGSPETTPGGRALKFYSSVRLDIRRIESIKDGAEVVGNRTRVKVVKNKVRPAVPAGRVRHHVRQGHQPRGLAARRRRRPRHREEVGCLVHLRGRAARPGPGERQELPRREPRDHGRDLREGACRGRHRAARRSPSSRLPTKSRSRSNDQCRSSLCRVGSRRLSSSSTDTGSTDSLSARDPRLLRAHLRVPDERARLRAHRRPARSRRLRRGRPTRPTPTSSCSTPAASARTPTTSSTAPRPAEAVEGARARVARSSVAGCLAQKDRDLVRQKAPVRRRRVRHAQRASHGRAARPRRASAARSPRSSTRPCSTTRRCSPALAGAPRDHVQRLGHDPDRLRQLVRVLHRAGGARRRDQPAVRRHRRRGRASSRRDGVSEVTLLGQNVNSYGRDLQVTARQAGDRDARLRPMFAELLHGVGAVDGIRRVRFTSPHPKDLRAETFAAMAATPARVRAPALPAAVGQRPDAGGDAPRLHRAALPRTARRRRAPRSTTSR